MRRSEDRRRQNVNRHLGEGLFKVFLASRWWVTPAFGQLFNDRFQNIQFRATPAAGAGVHIVDVPKVKWDFQTGIGYQYLNYRDTRAAGVTATPRTTPSSRLIPTGTSTSRVTSTSR